MLKLSKAATGSEVRMC